MSSFVFIKDGILRSNLDTAIDHINELVTVSESKNYRKKPVQVSSFRKTIIIHVAAIIEAILLWKLKKVCASQKIELDDEWKYTDVKILHEINKSEQIIAGKRIKEKRKLSRLDFLQLTRLCFKHQVIKTGKLIKDIDKVRDYRNRQHLGGLSAVERKYSKSDLEFCFNVVERVIVNVSP
jgi:hypothetical protein